MSCDVCQKAEPDIAGKTEFVTGKKKFKRASLVYHNTRGSVGWACVAHLPFCFEET